MTFADLHHADKPLLLPNAWDVPSALAFLDAGFAAIGTTSFGVAGVNIEDSTAERLISPQAHAAKVAAVKARTPDVFVNARIDTYWLHQEETVDATLERAYAYVEAGADGVFVPGAGDPEVLRTLTRAIAAPLNTLVIPSLSLDALGALGVRRVSTGSLPYRAAIHAATEAATAVRDGRAIPASAPYAELQARLRRYEDTLP